MFDDDDDFMGFEENRRSKKRKPGRPQGSKNRSLASKETERKLEAAYKRLSPMLSKEQREYLDELRAGKRAFDAKLALSIMLRQVEVIFADVSEEVWDSKTISREFSELINAYRMGIKDFEDINRARTKDAEVAQSDTEDAKKARERHEKQFAQTFGPPTVGE